MIRIDDPLSWKELSLPDKVHGSDSNESKS